MGGQTGGLPLLNPTPILICRDCDDVFSAIDVAFFRYDWRIGACSDCLQALKDSPARVSCFGKENSPPGRGFDEDCSECSRLCPDRAACPSWIGEEMSKKLEYTEEMRKAASRLFRQMTYQKLRKRKIEREHPFRKGTIMRIIWDKAESGIAVEQIRSLCDQISARPEHYLRTLRREFANGYTWQVSEDEGVLRVSDLRRMQK